MMGVFGALLEVVWFCIMGAAYLGCMYMAWGMIRKGL